MKIGIKPSALKQTRPKDYVMRFVFGGLITAVAGLIAKEYGPVVGGLFLAFPAILPAILTLVEKHEDQKKPGNPKSGTMDCGVDAAGAAIGSLGLLAFGGTVWKLGPRLPAWEMLPLALLTWLAVSGVCWALRERI